MSATKRAEITRPSPLRVLRVLCGHLFVFSVAGVAACSESPVRPTVMPPQGAGVLVGAGDIAVCGSTGTAATAALLDQIPGTVFTAGDNAYHHGSRLDYQNCYEPTWGRHKTRTRPSPGNHEYEVPGGAAYFAYFGESAGPGGLGYYNFIVQNWLVISLNSNLPAGPGSPQLEWLRMELAGRPTRCIAAIWHHPLLSSGPNAGSAHMRDVWRLLYDAGADLIINGHEHLYERFAPLDGQAAPNPAGMRLFVVGTGGAELSPVQRVQPGSEMRVSVHGVLKLTLEPDAYQWEFIGVPGSGVRDLGRHGCR